MSDFIDKCYHVACTIPRAQTVIGVSFAIKDLVGIIKDIAMNTLFKDYADSVNENIQSKDLIDQRLRQMFKQNNEFFNLGYQGDDNDKKTAKKGMQGIENALSEMHLYLPVSDFTHLLLKNERNPLIKTNRLIDEHITEAIFENNKQLNQSKKISFFIETVPAKERLYNLATAVISAIPVVGTIYNVSALGYFCFIKP